MFNPFLRLKANMFNNSWKFSSNLKTTMIILTMRRSHKTTRIPLIVSVEAEKKDR